MAAPLTPPQDIEDLDKLTRLELEFRQQQSTRRLGWLSGRTVYLCLLYGFINWTLGPVSSSFDSLVHYCLIVAVIIFIVGDSQQHTNERLQVIEKQLADLTEELAHRSREQSRGVSHES